MRIEDYALIGDTQTAALVARDGSIDWLCLPRFDSPACFAALIGRPEHGRWRIAPAGAHRRVRRRYRPGTLVLETEITNDEGTIRLVDAMPIRQRVPDLVRLVEGVEGTVTMELELILRFDYGAAIPWVRSLEGRWLAVAGPDAVVLDTPVDLQGVDLTTVARFTVRAGDVVPFVLAWHPSHEPSPPPLDAVGAVADTTEWWTQWSAQAEPGHGGQWAEAAGRSLLTLKALTHAPTGGIVAAPTTSLPECIGGVRNWDYRFCWLRDATFTLHSLLVAGYTTEALAWRDWMLRAVGGDPRSLQVLYGPAGERSLPERTLDHLPGYEGSAPVRVGNAAACQFQLDVYGEVLDTMHRGRRASLPYDEHFWDLEQALLDVVEAAWVRPDAGIWEIRGPEQHFTYSKVMAWVALDRAVKAVEQLGLEGPVDRWRATRDQIHDEVCREGFDAERNTFVQHYGAKVVDAALLRLPLVGFIAPDDPRVAGTIAAVEQDLVVDGGYVLRYLTDHPGNVDALPPGEGCFLPCTLWLADAYALVGRRAEAGRLLDQVLAVANDVGLLAEEYDPVAGRMLGNFPQAFSHVGVVNTARQCSAPPAPPSG